MNKYILDTNDLTYNFKTEVLLEQRHGEYANLFWKIIVDQLPQFNRVFGEFLCEVVIVHFYWSYCCN